VSARYAPVLTVETLQVQFRTSHFSVEREARIVDGPVSMVDASLRMSIVNLFGRLCDAHGLPIVCIMHDLATACSIADRLIIMRKGEVVEAGAARDVSTAPQHRYSKHRREAVPTPDSAGLFRVRRTASERASGDRA
jgi:peptide/nickel transport system ATP-binding protein